ncbi:hypothetical protein BC936DRAFT_137117 [Jimgerdemannia flammicorona]|uniref:Uncharacterized protein n=1 Tax=Jimgerdemannia flammicorona TaxID=994334 RepID=A0A433CY04_9FUNG|nr:hypothetical protein BC936DRAFT_137117 [Jimgerdemannia flammicorona]
MQLTNGFVREIVNSIQAHHTPSTAFEHLKPKPKSYTDVLFTSIFSTTLTETCSPCSVDISKANAGIISKELSSALRHSIDPKAFTPLLRRFSQYEDEAGQHPLREAICHVINDLLMAPVVPKNVLRWLFQLVAEECRFLLEIDCLDTNCSLSGIIFETRGTMLTACQRLKHTVGHDDLELYRLLETALYQLETSKNGKDVNAPIDDTILLERIYKYSAFLDRLITHPFEHPRLATEIAEQILPPGSLRTRPIGVMFHLYLADYHDQMDLLLRQLCVIGAITEEDYETCHLPRHLERLLFETIPLASIRLLEIDVENFVLALSAGGYQEDVDPPDLDLPNIFQPVLDVFTSTETEADYSKISIDLLRIACDAPTRFMPRILLVARVLVELEERKRSGNEAGESVQKSTKTITARAYLNMWSTVLVRALSSTPHSSSVSYPKPPQHHGLPYVIALFLLTFPVSTLALWTQPSPSASSIINFTSTHKKSTPFADFLNSILTSYRRHLRRHGFRSKEGLDSSEGDAVQLLVRAAMDHLGMGVPVVVLAAEAEALARFVDEWEREEDGGGVVEILSARVRNCWGEFVNKFGGLDTNS